MKQKAKEYQTVVLAALLHDVGKLLGHGHFLPLNKGQHPRFSAEFVEAFPEVFAAVSDTSLLRELVQRHHNDKEHFNAEFLVQNIKDRHERTLATLVSTADKLSSSQPGVSSEQWQDYLETPLASILERVNQIEMESPRLRYHARPLQPTPSLEVIFPDEFPTFGQGELDQHIVEFREDFHQLFRNGKIDAVDTTDFDCLISHMLSVLYKYTWCIPSNTQDSIPDVSLYDHLKIAATVASCMYLYHSSTQTLDEHEIRQADVNRFCLVVGDLSGIQKYIFDIATIGTGGDDLFLVGPWDKILDMAENIKSDFTKFTGNLSLTISAGVAITRHDFPIANAAQNADDALELSKQEGRDRITVLGNTLTWADWTKVKAEWKRLRPHVGQTPSAFLYNLLRFSAMWRRYKEDKDTLGLRYHPLLAYSISRNLDQRKMPELYEWSEKILTLRPGNKEHELILDNLGLIASLLIYSKRGGSV
ncbi:hypothetical protein ES708_06151 [subsurface metagenome]